MTMRPSPIQNMLLTLLLFSLIPGCGSKPAGEHADNEAHENHRGDHDEHEAGHVELSPEAASRIKLKVARISVRPLPAVLTTTGRVDFDANRLAHVSPRIPGRVHAVKASLGDDVGSGEALAVLDSIELGEAKAAFLRARAQHELARRNFEREQGLMKDNITSEREVLLAEATLREAAADLAATEQRLHLYGLEDAQIEPIRQEDPQASLYTLRAPFAGRVVDRHLTLGELVTPEHKVFTIADLSQVWIWIDVYERDLRQVHVDDDVAIELEAVPGMTFTGQISYLSDQVDANTRTARARVDVPNPDGRIRPGSFARVRVSDPHLAADACASPAVLAVPETAIQQDGGQSFVFVALGDRRFERRDVQLGRQGSGFAEVRGGLSEGEDVVVEGAFLLRSEASKEAMGGGHSH